MLGDGRSGTRPLVVLAGALLQLVTGQRRTGYRYLLPAVLAADVVGATRNLFLAVPVRLVERHEVDRETLLNRALLLTGVAGVGKSTVADAIGEILTAAGFVTAVVDTDALAQFGPPPHHGERRGSRFYDHLKCINLAAVWANYRAVGARFVVVSAGIDSAPLRSQYAASLAGCEVQLVRLVAAADTVGQRLRERDGEAKRERHLRTLAEREARVEAIAIEDFTVVNDRPAIVVAGEVIVRAGWVGAAG